MVLSSFNYSVFFRFFWFFDLAVAVAVDFVIAAAIVTVDDTEVLQPNELI